MLTELASSTTRLGGRVYRYEARLKPSGSIAAKSEGESTSGKFGRCQLTEGILIRIVRPTVYVMTEGAEQRMQISQGNKKHGVSPNRVGGWSLLLQPSSHTTARTVLVGTLAGVLRRFLTFTAIPLVGTTPPANSIHGI